MHTSRDKKTTKSADLTAIDPKNVAAIQAALPSDALLSVVVSTFQALADPTRLKILYALTTHACCVRDLAILVGVSESAVSHQLRLLRDRHLIQQKRDGNLIYYSLDDHHLSVFFREAEYHADHVYRGIPDHPYPLAESTRYRSAEQKHSEP